MNLGMGMIMMKQMLLKDVDNKHADWHDIVQNSLFAPFSCMSTPNKVSKSYFIVHKLIWVGPLEHVGVKVNGSQNGHF